MGCYSPDSQGITCLMWAAWYDLGKVGRIQPHEKEAKSKFGTEVGDSFWKRRENKTKWQRNARKIPLLLKQHLKTLTHFSWKVFWTWVPSGSSQHLVLFSSTVKPLFWVWGRKKWQTTLFGDLWNLLPSCLQGCCSGGRTCIWHVCICACVTEKHNQLSYWFW